MPHKREVPLPREAQPTALLRPADAFVPGGGEAGKDHAIDITVVQSWRSAERKSAAQMARNPDSVLARWREFLSRGQGAGRGGAVPGGPHGGALAPPPSHPGCFAPGPRSSCRPTRGRASVVRACTGPAGVAPAGAGAPSDVRAPLGGPSPWLCCSVRRSWLSPALCAASPSVLPWLGLRAPTYPFA